MPSGTGFFPDPKQEALALEYIKSQDLSRKTPEEVAEMYQDAYTRICETFKSIRDEKRAERNRKSLVY